MTNNLRDSDPEPCRWNEKLQRYVHSDRCLSCLYERPKDRLIKAGNEMVDILTEIGHRGYIPNDLRDRNQKAWLEWQEAKKQ